MRQIPEVRPSALPSWLVAVGLLMLPWLGWVAVQGERSTGSGLLEVGVPILLAWLAARTLWGASRRTDVSAGFQSAMRWIASGFAMLGVATLYVLIHDVLLKAPAQPAMAGVADLLFMSAYPLVMFGQFRLPRAAHRASSVWRVLADSAVFLFGVGLPLWVFAVRPSLSSLRGMEAFVALAFPILAFLGIIAVNFTLLHGLTLPSRRGFHLLLAGLATSWGADLVFTLQVTQRLQLPQLYHLTNLINGVSLVLALLGAWWLRSDPVPVQPPRPAAFSPIPMVTFLVSSLWLARYLQVFEVSKQAVGAILVSVVALLGVLLAREALIARDSFRQATQAVTLALRVRFEALVENSADLILVLDRTGCLVYVSPAAVKFLGGSEDALLGLPLLEFLHPEERGSWQAFLADLLAGAGPLAPRPFRMRNAGGDWRALDASGNNLLDNPEVQGLVLNARDITERRQWEDQLHQAVKMDALGRLAGGIAHDFNNLLFAILGNVELARINQALEPRLAERLDRIQEAATRGAELAARILTFNRRQSPRLVCLDAGRLGEFLPLAQRALDPRFGLDLDLEPGAGSFLANAEDLQQLFLDLVSNARDAMPAGGRIQVRIRNAETLDSSQVLFLAPGPGPYLLLEISDTGSGMDEAVLAHLFEPFFTTKGKDSGSGLGLVGVYGIVKSWGGGIGIHSAPGQGTCIRLWFPRVAPAAQAVTQILPDDRLLGSETLLLVEDEEAVREVMREILESLGHQVFVAGSANQARAFVKDFSGHLDLLVTDVIMPGDSGPKLAAELVRNQPDLRVLYISGYTAGELEAHGLAHPGALLLEKPFTREQLGKRIREVLGSAEVAAG